MSQSLLEEAVVCIYPVANSKENTTDRANTLVMMSLDNSISAVAL